MTKANSSAAENLDPVDSLASVIHENQLDVTDLAYAIHVCEIGESRTVEIPDRGDVCERSFCLSRGQVGHRA